MSERTVNLLLSLFCGAAFTAMLWTFQVIPPLWAIGAGAGFGVLLLYSIYPNFWGTPR